MCGICGVVQVGEEPRTVVAPELLDHMTDLMEHRGPNDRGTYIAPGVALGVRRLSIVDVEGGHQPFSNEDQTVWAIQNGELYNHVDVRRRLGREGHVFASRCATEVIPHLYERAARLSRNNSAANSASRYGTDAGAAPCSRATGSV